MAEIAREINATLAARRKKAHDELERRKAEAYAAIPGLAALDEEINMSGIRLARQAMRGETAGAGAVDLSGEIEELGKRRESLLIAHGFPADYLKPRYECEYCEDTGTIVDPVTYETSRCNCYRRLYLDSIYQVSNILNGDGAGFDSFNEEYYSDTPNKKLYDSDVSPRKQILAIRNHCMDFIEGFENPKVPNLYFFGSAGTGKTFMAKSVGLELIKRGYTVLYLSAPNLFETIRRARFGMDGEGAEPASTYADLINTNLLIIDDLGTEPASDARYAELLTLLEARKTRSVHHPCKIIISSNLSTRLLFQTYNERIVSRIAGEFGALKFFGEDIRILKKYRD